MKLAFTSCFSAQSFKKQPVWEQIGEAAPDELLLLGDAAYYDADGSDMGSVKAMGANDFAGHAYGRLRDQLDQPQFANLVSRATLRTHAIWDDHDFLWNGACGAQIEGQPSFRHLIPPTRAAFQAFRDALKNRLPASFPPHPPSWRPDVKEPGYSTVNLGNKTLLHLTDGRSYKSRLGKDALLGAAQMQSLEDSLRAAHPDTVHLVASGLVFEARHGENWMDCASEHKKLLALAAEFRILMLSGDIHENRIAPPYAKPGAAPGGRCMFEITSSGAALRTGVTLGALQCNWGLLDIDSTTIRVQLSQLGMAPRTRTIDRQSWTMLPPPESP